MFIPRVIAPHISKAAKAWPAITITGPRQSGKTTLCKHLFKNLPYVSLDDSHSQKAANDDPQAFLRQFPRGAILDEVQKTPQLLGDLKGFIDNDPAPGRWILTGSQNFALLKSIKESLAGSTALYTLLPMTYKELQQHPHYPKNLEELLFYGSYPPLYSSPHFQSRHWITHYISTYLERDIKGLMENIHIPIFRKFLKLCAYQTSQIISYSKLASDMAVPQNTIKQWLAALEASYIVFLLPKLDTNKRKSLMKAAKLHFYDTGLVCALLEIEEPQELKILPYRGAIFESWMVSEIMKTRANQNKSITHGMYYYRDQQGRDADLIIQEGPLQNVMLLEAKSSPSILPNALNRLKPVEQQLAKKHMQTTTAAIIHGGDTSHRYNSHQLLSWQDIHNTHNLHQSL